MVLVRNEDVETDMEEEKPEESPHRAGLELIEALIGQLMIRR